MDHAHTDFIAATHNKYFNYQEHELEAKGKSRAPCEHELVQAYHKAHIDPSKWMDTKDCRGSRGSTKVPHCVKLAMQPFSSLWAQFSVA